MRAKDVIAATAHEWGIVTLSGIHDNMLTIIGASVGNLPGGNMISNSQSFSIERGQTGMVAISAYVRKGYGKNQMSESYYFFLGVSWEDKEGSMPVIDLNQEWVPKDQTRLGRFYYSQLEVVIDGVTYSTSLSCDKENEKRFVPNTNLICRYMDGKIDKAQFLEETDAPAKQASELDGLRNENVALRSQNEQLNRSRIDSEDRIAKLVVALRRQIISMAMWKMVVADLKAAVSKQWFHGKTLKAVLARIKRKEKLFDAKLLQDDCINAEMRLIDLATMMQD